MEKKEEVGKKRNLLVLVDTSLDTHIGMSLSPTTTVGELKREFAKEHPIYFPSIGEIKVNGIMVKRWSCYYHLPDWTILKDFFYNSKRPRLHVDASPSDGANPCQSEPVVNQVNSVCDDFDSWKPEDQVACEDGAREGGKGEDFRCTQEHMERNKEMCSPEQMVEVNGVAENVSLDCERERRPPTTVDAPRSLAKNISLDCEGEMRPPTTDAPPSLNLSEVASVTCLITRYFPESDKVESAKCPSHSETGSCASYHGSVKKPRKRKRRSAHKSNAPQCTTSRTPARLFSFLSAAADHNRAPRDRTEGPQVGKRLQIVAAAAGGNKKSPISLRKLASSSSVDQGGALVFEISDSV